MNIIGLDIGYNAVKAVCDRFRSTFPSTAGSSDTAHFSLNAANDTVIEWNGKRFLVGESSIIQSRFEQRQEDRHWYNSEQYKILYYAALASINAGDDIHVITGLPSLYFASDKEELEGVLGGEFSFTRNGKAFTGNAKVTVVPQPFGTLFDLAFDDQGGVIDLDMLQKTIGIIDIGGKTTNILTTVKAAEVAKDTTTIKTGGWDVVRSLKDALAISHPDREFRDHELAEVVRVGHFDYFDDSVDIREKVKELSLPFAQNIISAATQRWNGGASISKIVITGGGSYLLGQHILAHFRHATIAKNPVYGNALGYAKVATYYEAHR